MPRTYFFLLILFLAGCEYGETTPNAPPKAGSAASQSPATPVEPNKVSLVEARRGFTTKLVRQDKANEPVPEPPADTFRTVQYDSAVGKLAAYLSPDPGDGTRHPAIIWITGGDCNTINELWKDEPASNDQTARAFRESGMIMMFPSLRGGNQNPGVKEGFLGEVDDVLAAAKYLAQQPFVDPQRIYLGGHSTGGTMVLLVAECSRCFRAVFSFGPVANVGIYPPQFIPFDVSNRRELELRAPALWLHCVEAPVFVFEGTVDGNLDSLQLMQRASTNSKVHFCPIAGASHFSILAPITRLIAEKLMHDDGPSLNVTFTEAELSGAMK